MVQRLNSDVLFDVSNFPKAATFLNAVLSQKYKVVVYGGAIRGGKSYTGVSALVLLHKMYPKSRSIIVRDTLETLRRNTLPTCEKAIPQNFIKNYKGDPQFEWTFDNGSKMFFFAEGYEKDKEYNRWNGLEVNFIFLDQVEELQKKALEKSMERAGSYFIKNGKQPEPVIIMTVNPTDTWCKELVYDKWKKNQLPENWLYIPAYITDNPFVPKSFIDGLQELKKISPVKYKRFVEGDWEIREKPDGAFWKDFDPVKHVRALDFDQNTTVHCSFDENVNPYPALGVWQVSNFQIKQLHEIALTYPRNKLKEVAKELSQYLKTIGYDNIVYLYGDASSAKEDTKLEKGLNYFTIMKREIESYGFKVRIKRQDKNPPVALSAEFINAIYLSNYLGYEILINETCKESIKDYVNALEAGDGSMLKKKTNGVELTGHFSDQKRYFITNYLREEFKKFKRVTSDFNFIVDKSTQKYNW